MGGACGTYGGQEKCIHCFRGETLGKEPLGRPKHRWEDDIKMDFQGVGWCGMDWIALAQNSDKWLAVVKTVMNIHVP
jgi:hypothetical protein